MTPGRAVFIALFWVVPVWLMLLLVRPWRHPLDRTLGALAAGLVALFIMRRVARLEEVSSTAALGYPVFTPLVWLAAAAAATASSVFRRYRRP